MQNQPKNVFKVFLNSDVSGSYTLQRLITDESNAESCGIMFYFK